MRIVGYIAASVGIAWALWLLDERSPKEPDFAPYYAKAGVFSKAIMIRDREIGGISLYLVFPSGEASNPFDEGLAHYVEHLAWLSAFGAKANKDGKDDKDHHTDARINHFSTIYRQDADADDLPDSLRKLISVSAPLSVDRDFALQERDILLREYDFRVLERPLYPVYRDMDRSLYGKGGLARSVLGEPPTIARYSLEDAKSLHRQSHVLANATLLAYGNMSEKRFEAVLDTLSGEIEGESAPLSVSTDWVEEGSSSDSAFLSLPGLAEDIFIYRKLVPLSACDSIARCEMIAQIAENALDSTLPGGLAKPLRFDRFVARRFSFDIDLIGDRYLHIGFDARPDRGIPLEELQRVFEVEFQAILENGLPQESFERILSRIEDDLDGVLERDRPRLDFDLALGRLMTGKAIVSLSDKRKALRHIRADDLNRFLKSLANEGREATRLVKATR